MRLEFGDAGGKIATQKVALWRNKGPFTVTFYI